MVRSISAAEVTPILKAGIPLLDVRSEAEFERGRVPASVSLPLFNNNEREQIGTTFKQVGQQQAVLQGLELVGPKMRSLVEHAMALAPDRKVALYCWRGGMRSGSVAWLLAQAGFEVFLIKGGYKVWRNYVLSLLAKPWKLIVLGGATGSGKTHVLNALPGIREQAIDLEAYAHHRGSAFGAIGLPPQPTVEMFENRLAFALEGLDIARRIWVEDESRTIGRVVINDPFWTTMQTAPLIVLEVSLERRVQNLVGDYACLPKQLLAESITRLTKKLGPQHAKAALESLEVDDFADVARKMLVYYDKTYQHTLDQKAVSALTMFPVPNHEAATRTASRLAKEGT